MNARPEKIAEIARRVAGREDRFDPAVREFLDSWQGMSQQSRAQALTEEPLRLGDVEDAYLGALAEHLASEEGLSAPAWTESPRRFLHDPFFAGGLEALKALLIVESPSAFRRRLIFISADGLSRPRRGAFSDDRASP
jgi:hypothetical protein